MTTLLSLAQLASSDKDGTMRKELVQRVLSSIIEGDPEKTATALTSAMAFYAGRALVPLAQDVAIELFGGEIEEPEEPIDEGSKRPPSPPAAGAPFVDDTDAPIVQ